MYSFNVHVLNYLYVHVCVHMCICVCVYMYVCTCTCMSVCYMYMYVLYVHVYNVYVCSVIDVVKPFSNLQVQMNNIRTPCIYM